MKRDTVTGIVGGLILVTALAGVFLYERNATTMAPPSRPDAAQLSLAPVGGTVEVGKSDEKLVNVTRAGYRNATFTLTWTAAQGKDTLKLAVAPPTGSGVTEGAASAPSDAGTITVTVRIPEGASGVGAWKVKVDFVQADLGAPIAAPVPPPAGTDSSVSWSVAGKLT